MPIFKLMTNAPAAKIPQDFLQSTTNLIATMLSKPPQVVLVCVEADQKLISFGGTTELCAFAELSSISGLGVAENKKYSAAIGAHVKTHLGIDPKRMFIKFCASVASDVGYNETTIG